MRKRWTHSRHEMQLNPEGKVCAAFDEEDLKEDKCPKRFIIMPLERLMKVKPLNQMWVPLSGLFD